VLSAGSRPGTTSARNATLRRGRRTANVVATSDMTLFAMSRFNLHLLAVASPTIAETLEVAVRERLAAASPKRPTES